MRRFAILAGLVLAASGAVYAAGQKDETASSAAVPQVELSMYLLGDAPKDWPVVLDELNKLTARDLSAALKVNFISWGDYNTKYHLILAAGEPVDLIYSAEWVFFKEEAQKGAFLALNDLLPKAAPRTFQTTPKEAWEEVTIDGKIYAVPANSKGFETLGFFVRGDLRKKYGVSEIKDLQDFGAYMDAVKKNETGLIPFDAGAPDLGTLAGWMRFSTGWVGKGLWGGMVYDLRDPKVRIFPVNFRPEMEQFLVTMSQWAAKGYWSRSVLSNQSGARESFMNGKSAAVIVNDYEADELYRQVKSKYPPWEPEWHNMNKGGAAELFPYHGNGVSVGRSSRNPERALMLLEKLRNDRAYFDLTTYGILGKHYALTSDGRVTLPAGLAAADNPFPPDSACPWGWRTDELYRPFAETWDLIVAERKDMGTRAVMPQLTTFILERSAIQEELNAIDQEYRKYHHPLMWGLVDPIPTLTEYRAALKKAGLDKVQAEEQAQVDRFLQGRGG